MSETWYRPNDWKNDEVEELSVTKETAQCIYVEHKGWNGRVNVRRQEKRGATKSRIECLRNMLDAARRQEQRANDRVSDAIKVRKNIEAQLAKEQQP